MLKKLYQKSLQLAVHKSSKFFLAIISFVESSDFHKIVGMGDMILNVDKLKELEFEPCFSIWNSIDELFKR